MAPRENIPPSGSTPVQRLLGHITISSKLTVDISTFKRLFESLAPITMELIELYSRHGDVPFPDQCAVLVQTLNEIWKRKDKLKGKEPGRFIARTVMSKLHAYLENRGWGDKWKQICDRIERYNSVIKSVQDSKN